MKKFISIFSLAFFASGFNTLYKYILVKNDLLNYNNNSSILGTFVTSSSSHISYISIFLLSLFFSLCLFVLYLRVFNFDYKYVLWFDLLLLFSSVVLLFNVYFALIVLTLGFLIIFFSLRRVCNIKLVILVFSFLFISLYFVSS